MGQIHAERTFEKPDWGSYYIPHQPQQKENSALRVVLFGSTLGGMWVLETLKKLKQLHGKEQIQLVGLVTDEARVPHARISVKKRIWHYYEQETRATMVDGIISMALDQSMEVFTGNIKSAFFSSLLEKWNPDVIIMACFGQIVPANIFNYPAYGMYNFHPSDLKNDIGAGPRPFEDTLALNMTHTYVSVLEVTDVIDHGPMVMRSTPIRITGQHGELFHDVLIAEEKIIRAFPYLAYLLVNKVREHKLMGIQKTHFTISVSEEMDDAVQQKLLEPVTGVHNPHYPFIDSHVLHSILPIPITA
jgi:methionyl-tRNA formyltransferase